jgi:hypothetical protein
MLGKKATPQTSIKLGQKVHSSYGDSLGSKYILKSVNGSGYNPIKDGQNLLTHKKQSPLEKLHNGY